jgi:hypothetical protein
MVRNSSNNCRHSAAGRAICACVSWRKVPLRPWHAAPAAALAGGFAARSAAAKTNSAHFQRMRDANF